MDNNKEYEAKVSYNFLIPDISNILSIEDSKEYPNYDAYFKTANSIDTLKKVSPVFYALLNHEEITETFDKGITEFILAKNTVTNKVRLVSHSQTALTSVPSSFMHYSFLNQLNTYFKKIVNRDLSEVEKKSLLNNMIAINVSSVMSMMNGLLDVNMNIINTVDIYDIENFYDVFTDNYRIIPHFVSFELEENEIPLLINFKMERNENNIIMISDINGIHVNVLKNNEDEMSYQYEELDDREYDMINDLLKDNFILDLIVSQYRTITQFI